MEYSFGGGGTGGIIFREFASALQKTKSKQTLIRFPNLGLDSPNVLKKNQIHFLPSR